MDSAFALRERNATQSVSAHLTQAVSALPLTPASALDGMKRTRVALIAEITAAAERIIGLSQSSATAAAEAKEAAEKAQTWSMVGCIVALVVVIVIAIIVSVFTFGAAGPAMVAASMTTGVTSGTSKLGTLSRSALAAALISAVQAAAAVAQFSFDARNLGHPLAGRFGVAMNAIAVAGRSAATGDARAADEALRSILQSLLQIETLTSEARSLAGPCLGDPAAVFQCARDTGPLLTRLSQIAQTMQLLQTADTQSVVRVLSVSTSAVARLTPLVPRR